MLQINWLFVLVTVTVAFAVWLKFYLKKKYSFWSAQGIPGPKPIPFLGDLHKRFTANVIQFEIDMAATYGKTYGTYIGLKPALITSDPELLKIIFIKAFPNFVNRFKFDAIHEMWGENLLFSLDEKWKRIRAITTPSFTSGKLRSMGPQMNRCIDNLVTFLDDVINNKNGIFDTKTVISGLTMDIIAATAFSTDINSNFETNSKSSFAVMGKRMFDQNLLKGLGLMLLPKWFLNLIGLEHPFHNDAFQFFIDLTRHILKERRQTGSRRNDLIQMMLDASVDENDLNNYQKMAVNADAVPESQTLKSSSMGKHKLTDTEIIANSIFFLLAGYETTSSTISHTLFSLAHNPEIQNRLYKEITETLENTDGSQTFETVIIQMPLLEATLKETLRLYPSVPNNSRLCGTDNYRLENIVLHKDYLIGIPVTAVHYNAEYYPEPMRFHPDRFMPKNKHLLVPYTYIPFGLGSRNCIGMRFAYQEMKLCLVKLLCQYRFCCAPETPEKLVFKNTNNLLNSVNFPLLVEKR